MDDSWQLSDQDMDYIFMEAYASSPEPEEMDFGENEEETDFIAVFTHRPASLLPTDSGPGLGMVDDEMEEYIKELENDVDLLSMEQLLEELDYIFMEEFASMSDYEDEEEEEPTKKKSRGVGRPPLTDEYPEIIPVLNSYIRANGAGAHDRRHDDTVYSHGISLKNMRVALMNRIPQLGRDVRDPTHRTKLSLSTIHHLLIAPRANSGAQMRDHKYRGVIKAKVTRKRNTVIAHKHRDGHFAAAQFQYARELAELFPREVFVMTCDDKNKLTMGLPAVHHLNQQRKFYPVDDAPDLFDHDFPSGQKLTPSGYAFLKHKSDPLEKKIWKNGRERKRGRSLDRGRSNITLKARKRSYSADSDRFPKEFCIVDRNMRLHTDVPHTGPSHLFIKPDMFHPATSELHANHLSNLITEETNVGRNSGVILCDGGPDWNFRFTINLLNYGRLWWELFLDVLILVCYAPGESRFNPIEHFWALVNLWLGKSTVPRSISVGSRCYSLGDRGGFYDSLICQKAVAKMVKYCSSNKDFIKTWNGFASQARGVPNDSSWKRYNDHVANKAQIINRRRKTSTQNLSNSFAFSWLTVTERNTCSNSRQTTAPPVSIGV